MLTPEIAGRSHGNGAPMVLIHGVGMCGDYWVSVEEDLAKSFSLTVIDLPGHGASPCLSYEEPTLAVYTDCVSEVLSKISDSTIIVGHSMGAVIALDLAVRYSNLTGGIAVLNGIYRRSREAQKSIDARVQQLITPSEKTIDSSATLTRWFGKEPTGKNAVANDLCKAWLEQMDPAGYRDAYRAFANADAPMDDQLQNISCPALFVTGSLEPNSTPTMSLSMSELLPNAKCVVVDGAKHMMSMTHADEVTRSIIDAFQ